MHQTNPNRMRIFPSLDTATITQSTSYAHHFSQFAYIRWAKRLLSFATLLIRPFIAALSEWKRYKEEIANTCCTQQQYSSVHTDTWNSSELLFMFGWLCRQQECVQECVHVIELSTGDFVCVRDERRYPPLQTCFPFRIPPIAHIEFASEMIHIVGSPTNNWVCGW